MIDSALTRVVDVPCLVLVTSRDGTFRLWNGADLKHFKTMSMGSSWITDCIFMPTVSCVGKQPAASGHPGTFLVIQLGQARVTVSHRSLSLIPVPSSGTQACVHHSGPCHLIL